MHRARVCLIAPKSDAWLPFAWATAKTFGLLIMAVTVLASVLLSSCGATSSALSGMSVNSSASAVNSTPGAATAPSGPAQSNTVTSHDVSLRWDPSISSGVLGYNVYRASGSGGPYTRLNSSIVAATNYTDTAVQSGQTYYYVVTASSGDLESAYSNEIAAVIP